MKNHLFLLLAILPCLGNSQSILDQGELHGNFQLDAQYYNSDSLIGAPEVPEKMLMRGYTNLNYRLGNFTAGVRYETYLNTLQGFDPRYEGNAFPYRYASYLANGLDITVGNFYEQFGNGLIFRSYEEWGLGWDNMMDGVRLKYSPAKGVYLKGIIGKQRNFMDYGPGIVRGADLEIFINEINDSLVNAKTQLIIGGSIVSKYQVDQDPIYVLPENVASFAGRFNLIHGNFALMGEYAYKINDPSTVNNFIYKPGECLLLSGTYSRRGLGIMVSAKRVDNMDYRSNRAATGSALAINYIPAITKIHTYNLSAYYPYATQPNGEMGLQAEILYKFKKGSAIGGKYGTSVALNYSSVSNIDRTAINDTTAIGESGTLGYESAFANVGEETYFTDFNVVITKKFSKKVKGIFTYMNLLYNKDAVQGLAGYGTIFADIAIADVTFKLKPKHALRIELQSLTTEHDYGNWAMGLIEYSLAPHWFVAAFNEYNYGNKNEEKRLNYYTFQAGYKNKGNSFTIGYGRQRDGIFCAGGVCRYVPASNGFSLAITSSF